MTWSFLTKPTRVRRIDHHQPIDKCSQRRQIIRRLRPDKRPIPPCLLAAHGDRIIRSQGRAPIAIAGLIKQHKATFLSPNL